MSQEIKRLERPRIGRVLAGVCGGLAKYMEIDPTLVRVVFAAVIIFTCFTGLLLYAIMWALIPEEQINYYG